VPELLRRTKLCYQIRYRIKGSVQLRLAGTIKLFLNSRVFREPFPALGVSIGGGRQIRIWLPRPILAV